MIHGSRIFHKVSRWGNSIKHKVASMNIFIRIIHHV